MTQNNNAMMKTVVETFIIEETQDLIYDNEKLDQWNILVSELGLQGQTKICAPAKSPIPFLPMKATMVNVFKTLCSIRVDVEEYDKSPIPVEILSLVSLSKKEKYFSKVEIWFDDKDPDPVCVGITGEWIAYTRSYSEIGRFATKQQAEKIKETNPDFYATQFRDVQKYLIGRWADMKLDMGILTKKAKSFFKAVKMDEYNQQIRDYQRRIEDLNTEANRTFSHDDAHVIGDLGF